MKINKTIQFSKIKKSEILFLQEMLYEALFVPEGQPKFPKTILEEPEIRKYLKDWNQQEGDIAIVAKAEKELIGAIWGRLFMGTNKGYGFVNEETPEISMAIKKQYRKQGIGTQLLKLIELEYLQLNVDKLSLSVDKLNPAKELYKRNGYRLYEDAGTAITLLKTIEWKGYSE